MNLRLILEIVQTTGLMLIVEKLFFHLSAPATKYREFVLQFMIRLISIIFGIWIAKELFQA